MASFGTDTSHLVLHAVAPGLRRAGFGSLLLRWQLEAAVVAGIGSMTLEVRAGDAAASAFYGAFGFVPGERIAGYYSGREDAVRMRLAPFRDPHPRSPSPGA